MTTFLIPTMKWIECFALSPHISILKKIPERHFQHIFTKTKPFHTSALHLKKSKKYGAQENLDDDDYEEDSVPEKPTFYSNAEHPDYEDVELNFSTTKALDIMSTTFRMNQKSIDNAFYSAKTRKNHFRIKDKNTKILPEKDVFDIILDHDDDFVFLRRVQILGSTKGHSPKMWVRKWDNLKLPRINDLVEQNNSTFSSEVLQGRIINDQMITVIGRKQLEYAMDETLEEFSIFTGWQWGRRRCLIF